jgi:ketosteroid isomerase-like protein
MADVATQNAELITKFYEAFARSDGAAMAALYHENATFKDPAFDLKNGKEVGAMWKMLSARAKDFKLTFSNVKGTAEGGSADWVATYLYGGKNKVENHIHTEMKIEHGLIVKQIDSFNFYKWASQSLGTFGKLFGWLPPVHNTVRKKAMGQLHRYMAKHEQ